MVSQVVTIEAAHRGVSQAAPLMLVPARLGDADGDGNVDLDDYHVFVNCFRGPALNASPSCRAVFGFELDTHVDLADFAGFQNAYTGTRAGVPRIHALVDNSVSPPFDELLPLEGTGPRPLAAVVDDVGLQANFVADELMFAR